MKLEIKIMFKDIEMAAYEEEVDQNFRIWSRNITVQQEGRGFKALVTLEPRKSTAVDNVHYLYLESPQMFVRITTNKQHIYYVPSLRGRKIRVDAFTNFEDASTGVNSFPWRKFK